VNAILLSGLVMADGRRLGVDRDYRRAFVQYGMVVVDYMDGSSTLYPLAVIAEAYPILAVGNYLPWP
jgi:hypothetical protein